MCSIAQTTADQVWTKGIVMTVRDMVIFDGECQFCRKSVETLRRLDVAKRLEFVSLHSPVIAAKFPDLSHEMLMEQMWVVSKAGMRYGGADAIRYLSRTIPTLFAIAPLMHIPLTRPLWRALYRAVASRRYRLAASRCGDGTCSLHGAKVDA